MLINQRGALSFASISIAFYFRTSMAKETKSLLKWRSRLSRGAIMKPATFTKIARAAGGGAKGQRVAGRAYWNAAKAKFKRGSTRDLKRSSHT